LCCLCFVPAVFFRSAVVTFYTPGNTAKSVAAGLLPRSHQPFTGWLFDGRQRLAHIQHNRFMTLHLAAGEHKEPLLINVESGGQSCFRLYAKMTNFEVIPYSRLNSQIEEVPCDQAQREAAHMKAIDQKRVDPAVRGELAPATSFPTGLPAHN
jgi:hypothetical protein